MFHKYREIPAMRLLLLLNIFSVLLVLVRYYITGSPTYFILWWNLFLAAIPFGLALLIAENKSLQKNTVFIPLGILWLLFLPNAPYLITDLLHLSYSHHRYIWFDSLMILSYALCGLIYGLVSLKIMAEIFLAKTNHAASHVFISLSLFASGFGIYLGRYQRFNSWDIMNHPGTILGDIFNRISDPFAHPRTWAMTLLFGVFLHIIYYGVGLHKSAKSTPPLI